MARAGQGDAVPCRFKIGGVRPCGNTTTDPSGLCEKHRNAGATSAQSGQQARTASSATSAALTAAQVEMAPPEATVAIDDIDTHDLRESESDDYLLELVAVRDLPEFEVEAGDVGGLVEPGSIVSADSWVDEHSRVVNESKVLNGSLVADGSEVRDNSTMHRSRLESGSTLSGRSTMIDSRAVGACEIAGRSTVEKSELANECRVTAGSTVEKSSLGHHCLVEASTARSSNLSDGSQVTGGSSIDDISMSTSEVRDGSSVTEGCSLIDRAKVLRGSRASGKCILRGFATLSDGAEIRNHSQLDGACHVSNGTILDNTVVQRRVKLSRGGEIKNSVVSEAEVAGWHTTRAKA